MGNCLSRRQKSSMDHDMSITSYKAVDDESAKSPVKDGLIPPSSPLHSFKGGSSKLLSDSDSEDYFSAADDDETQLYDRIAINLIDHPESSSASCKGKLEEDAAATEEEVKETKQKILFELFNESSRVKEAQGRAVAVDLPADSPVQTKKKRSPAGKERALAAPHFRLPRLPHSRASVRE